MTRDATEQAVPASPPPLTPRDSRNAIRRELRNRRRALTPWERRRRNAEVARRLARNPLFLRSRHIALYLANDGEVDLTEVARRARAMGKRCYLPVLSPTFHNRLWFAPWHEGMRMAPNCFGIQEPALPWRAMRAARALDLILVPLVGFDRRGNRLGMGGGFYDRTLAYLARRFVWRKPRLVGVAYDLQEWPTLPAQSWDIPLEAVVTDLEFLQAGS